MQPLKSFVAEVEDAIASGEEGRRVASLRAVTSLFVDQAANLNEEHVGVFDEVIVRLAHEIEFRARVELAERLADISNAPRKTVRDLAFDDNIEIARPVIERSPRLEEKELVTLASERGQQHLLALAHRPHLPETVTDVLVVRGDQTVVRSVARNDSARFSELGFGTLVQRSSGDDDLQDILQTRGDLPAVHLQQLMAVAKERARRDLRASGMAAADDVLAAVLDIGAEEVLRGTGPVVLAADVREAEGRVSDLAAKGQLGEDEIVRLVKNERFAEALAGLGTLARLPAETVANAFGAPHYDALLFIVRGLRFSWPTFKAFLGAKSGGSPPPALLKSAFASYESLSVPTAQRVMRFVNAKQKVGRPAEAHG